jgi:hypothetical protein
MQCGGHSSCTWWLLAVALVAAAVVAAVHSSGGGGGARCAPLDHITTLLKHCGHVATDLVVVAP